MSSANTPNDWGTPDEPPAELDRRPLTPVEYVLLKNASTDAGLRATMVRDLTRLFVRLNASLFAGIAGVVLLDAWLIYIGVAKPVDRIVSSQVVMTLIGATAVQLGLGVAAMVAYLFPKRAGSGNSENRQAQSEHAVTGPGDESTR